MTAARINISIIAGDAWIEPVSFRTPEGDPVPWSEYDATMQIRSIAGAYGPSDETTLLVEATTGNGIEWLTDDELMITLPGEITRSLNPTNERQIAASWGLTLTDRATGNQTTVIEGVCKILGRTVR